MVLYDRGDQDWARCFGIHQDFERLDRGEAKTKDAKKDAPNSSGSEKSPFAVHAPPPIAAMYLYIALTMTPNRDCCRVVVVPLGFRVYGSGV